MSLVTGSRTSDLPLVSYNVQDINYIQNVTFYFREKMGDLFLMEDAQRLLFNKFVVIFGDSIQRGVYRDLVCILQQNVYLTPKNLKGKGERSFMGDELLEGGCLGDRHNNRHYRCVTNIRIICKCMMLV